MQARRSELTQPRLADIDETHDGLRVVRRSKTNQLVDQHSKLGASLSDRAIADMIKQRMKAAGLDDTAFSGYSLRTGLTTFEAQAGVSERVIAKQTGHKSLPVLWGYIREGVDVYGECGGEGIGMVVAHED